MGTAFPALGIKVANLIALERYKDGSSEAIPI